MASASRHEEEDSEGSHLVIKAEGTSSQQGERQLAQYGNFRNYYSIRGGAKGSSDTRVQDIVSFLHNHAKAARFRDAADLRILDIGCNSGEVTREFGEAMLGKASAIIGVDIDRDLILLANSKSRRMDSSKDHQTSASAFTPRVLGAGRVGGRLSNGAPKKRLRIEDNSAQSSQLYFFQSNWVFNDSTVKRCKGKDSPEDMTQMQVRDCLAMQEQDLQRYDIILALSVTKWIHIQHHDIGIRRFFARIASCLSPDGILILEQQGYKSYKQTLKVTAPDSTARRNFYALCVMPDDFPWILSVELGLKGPYRIRDKGDNGELHRVSLR